jgi:hypothetical protein
MAVQIELTRIPTKVITEAEQDGILLCQYVKSVIRTEILKGNPLVRLCDPFVVMRFDCETGKLAPCGSVSDLDEARQLAWQRIDEEPTCSENESYWGGDNVLAIHQIYTRDGFLVPLEEQE